MADRVVTVLWWNHEANPLVSELGMIPWLLVSVVAIGLVLAVWNWFGDTLPRCTSTFLAVVTGMHVLVVGSNLLHVSGY